MPPEKQARFAEVYEVDNTPTTATAAAAASAGPPGGGPPHTTLLPPPCPDLRPQAFVIFFVFCPKVTRPSVDQPVKS